MNIKNLQLPLVFAGLLFCGCQAPSSFERSVSLVPAEHRDPNLAIPEPIDPLEVLASIETIASRAGLKPYSTGDEEVSLLEIADTDLLGETDTSIMNVMEYKHPDLPVYLTVTRKPEEILILLNHTPNAAGKFNSEAANIYKSIEKKLAEMIARL